MALRLINDGKITEPIAGVFGIESDGAACTVVYRSAGGGLVLTVTARDRAAELRVYHAVIGKSVLHETNASTGSRP